MTNTWWRATLSQAVSSRVLAGTWSKTAWSAAACAGDLWVHRQCFTSEPSINPPIGMTFTKTALSENKANYTRIAPCCVTTTPSLSLANIHGNAGYARAVDGRTVQPLLLAAVIDIVARVCGVSLLPRRLLHEE